MASKRPRNISPVPESDSEGDETLTSSPIAKASRTLPGGGHQLLCTLPPTCHGRPTHLANTKDLESHYATYHAHVCEEDGCSCVFPDARFLELHQTECHDSLAAIRQERGEKIFACFLASCPKRFSNPKARRLHLIQAHGYPKEYFFAVTNKGVGGLLRRWGEGASMLRGEWKKRETSQTDHKDHEHKTDREDRNISDHLVDDTSDGDEEIEEPEHKAGNESDATERQSSGNGHATRMNRSNENQDRRNGGPNDTNTADINNLAENMSSLSLVPGSIRFGRGTSKVSFHLNNQHTYTSTSNGGRARSERGDGHTPSEAPSSMDVDNPEEGGNYKMRRQQQQPHQRGRGGIHRGRGMAHSGNTNPERGGFVGRRGSVPHVGRGRGRGIQGAI